jgi:hypothetical protein
LRLDFNSKFLSELNFRLALIWVLDWHA